MKAIEFTSKVTQGKNIEIPHEYINQVSGTFRVILLLEPKDGTSKKSRKKKFDAFRIATKELKFDRNEIYDE